MESMRIIQSNPFFFPYMGGIERVMHSSCKWLAKRGHDVTVLTAQLPGTPKEEETEDGYRIVRMPSKFYNIYNPPYVSTKGVLEYLNNEKPDIINHNYRWAFSFDGDVVKYSGKKTYTCHNIWGEGTGLQKIPSEINDKLFMKKLDAFDHVLAVSDWVRDDLIRRGVSADRVTTVENCLDELPELNDEKGDFILNLGRMVGVKGLDYLVEAMRQVDCKLIMCGRGPETKKLQKMISKYGLEDRVEIKGWVSEEEKVRLMGTCRFFVMPSIYEAYGIAAIEALSYGKPLVCTDVGGLPATVKDAGCFVKPRDSQGLADAINRMLADENLVNELSQNAIRVARDVTWEKQIVKMEDLFRKVINEDTE